jgi:inorganic phosphate transporter, PiT family
LPVSTTHSVVGAMIGFGIIAGGFSMVNWIKLGAIVMSWIISPVFSLIISYVMFKAIVRLILTRSESYKAALRLSPFFIGIAVFIVIMSFVFKTPLGSSLNLTTPVAGSISLLLALLAGFGGKRLLDRAWGSRADRDAESIFRQIQIGTSCYVALAQGANDVANAIGPLALIYFLVKTGEVGPKVPVPFFLLLFGGIGIALGVAMGGRRVIQTVGERITALTNTRGFSVDFAAATTVLLASKMGLPVSTTHAAVGGVLGVGLAGGIEAVNFAIVFRIMLYWVLTVPVSALTCMVVFKILQVFI